VLTVLDPFHPDRDPVFFWLNSDPFFGSGTRPRVVYDQKLLNFIPVGSWKSVWFKSSLNPDHKVDQLPPAPNQTFTLLFCR
jgi:hypothetical protein